MRGKTHSEREYASYGEKKNKELEWDAKRKKNLFQSVRESEQKSFYKHIHTHTHTHRGRVSERKIQMDFLSSSFPPCMTLLCIS
jgi:hypothetical protein